MGKMSKNKGAAFERTIASKLREYGYTASRTAQHCGKGGGAPDVEGLPGLWVECKAQERMHLYDWLDQAIRDSEAKGDGSIPVVIHKQNYKDILVSMRLSDFMEIYREWEADHE